MLVRNIFSFALKRRTFVIFSDGAEISSGCNFSPPYLLLANAERKTIARILNPKVGQSRLYFAGIIIAVSKGNTSR